MALNDVRITLDRSLGTRLGKRWKDVTKSVRRALTRALKANDYEKARDLIAALDLSKTIRGNTQFVRFTAAEAMVLGASQLSDTNALEINKIDQTDSIRRSVQFLTNAMLFSNETLHVSLLKIVDQHEDTFLNLQKRDLRKRDLKLPEIEDLIGKEVLGKGFAGIDVNSSLMNSRMSSFGFGLEAEVLGVEFYKIQAVLDSRTGDLDRRMHGTTFRVREAQSTLNRGFEDNTPEGWKANQPWFKVNKESLASIDRMSMSQMLNAGIHLPPYHPLCYKAGTKVCTKRGFIDFKDIDISKDLFLSMNPQTQQLSWTKALKFIDEDYSGDMVRVGMGWGRTAMVVTPDHSMYYERDVDRGTHREYMQGFFDLQDVTQRTYLTLTSKHEGKELGGYVVNDHRINMDVYLEFLGYYLSEGCIYKPHGEYFPIICQTKHFQRMWDCAEKLGYPATRWGEDKIVIKEKSLGKLLQQYGHAHEKYVPSWVKELPPRQIRIFLDAYLLGDDSYRNRKSYDGYRSISKCFSTSSLRMRNDLVELIVKVGGSSTFYLGSAKGTVTRHRNGLYASNHDCWVVNWLTSVRRRPTFKTETYTGKVYDVALEKDHTLLVSYEGSVVWGSNCRCIVVKSSQQEFVDFVGKTLPETISATPSDFRIGTSKNSVTDTVTKTWNQLKFGKPEIYTRKILGTDTAVDDIFKFEVFGTETELTYILENSTLKLERTIDIPNKKAIHTKFEIEPNKPALLKNVLKESIDSYVVAGLTTVELEAADLGAFAWAKYGWKPTQTEWNSLRDTIQDRWEQVKSNFSGVIRSEINAIFDSNPETIWKIADLTPKLEGVPLGQFLLKGTTWKGELALTDAAAMRRFRNFIG